MNNNTSDSSGITYGILTDKDTVVFTPKLDEKLRIRGYDTDSEETRHLACSECGEFITLVRGNRAVCGCSETPAEWTTDSL